MTDNKQLTAVELLNKIEPNGELLGTDKAIEFAIEYSALQNAELIKKINTLQFEIVDYYDMQFKYLELQKQNAELIKEVEELKKESKKWMDIAYREGTRLDFSSERVIKLKEAGNKMAEVLKRYTAEKARECISKWEKLNK